MFLALLLVFLIMGMAVISSYYDVFFRREPGNYLTHPYWHNMGSQTVIMFAIFQLLAVVGFLAAIITYIIDPPTTGLLAGSWMLPSILFFLLFFSFTWPYSKHAGWNWLSFICLFIVAAMSVCLLVGAVQEEYPRWWVVLGIMLLCIVTVLGDLVAWTVRSRT